MFPKYWENMYANENKCREVYSDIKIIDFYLCKQKANVHMIVFSVTQELQKPLFHAMVSLHS